MVYFLAQKHKMCKGHLNGSFVLHCCVQGAAIVTLAPDFNNGIFNFTTISEIPIQPVSRFIYFINVWFTNL